jgi:hypothetical protein
MFKAKHAGVQPEPPTPPVVPSLSIGRETFDTTFETLTSNAAGAIADSTPTSFPQLFYLMLKTAIEASAVNQAIQAKKYYDRALGAESRRVAVKQDELERNLFMTKQVYLMHERERLRLMGDAGVVQWFIATLAFCCLLAPSAMTSVAAMVIIGIALVCFGVYAAVYSRQKLNRRYDDWNKLYWGTTLGVAKKAAAGNSSDTLTKACEAT